MPTLDRWPEISRYLDQAFSLSSNERAEWLASLRAYDADLGALLQSFLDEHHLLEAEQFLEETQPAMLSLLGIAGQALAGQTIGPYTLISKIGEGGMGSVWLAERSDGELQMKVAIKFLRADNHDPVWRDRFLTERQFLASLHHSSIVHLLDAGSTQDGRPYLVMEYVEGVGVDVYSASLSMRERLSLFLQICAGVSHAHQRLVIHRDLKPSNILVDATGQPKLLDFGIAKLLDASGETTQTAERLLTPLYASPEQMRGATQSTATDVYSLGAVLYKLLTGHSPHQSATGRLESFFAMTGRRVIPPPSKIDATLPSDLDYILGKALRTEPEERYASVDAFADDIRALLESRPVRARAGDTWYRARKFLRRHWVPVTASAVVIAGLSTGIYIANRERAIAQQRFQQVRELAHTFVFDLYDEVAKLQGSTKVRELTVRKALQYLDSLSKNAGSDLDLQKEIAAAYLKIGDAQGFPTKPNLGRIDDALASYRKAGDLYRNIAANDATYLPDLARYYLQYASLVRFTHDLPHARALSESAIQTFDRMPAAQRQKAQSEQSYIVAWCTVGDMDEDLGHYRLAWNEFSRCGELARAWFNGAGGHRALPELAQADERIGTAAQELGLLPEALRAFDEGQKVLDELLALEPRNPTLHRRRALLDHYRAEVYFSDRSANVGRPALALESARHYLARAQQMAASDPNDTAAQFSLAVATFQVSFCLREFNPNEAVAMAREAVRIFDRMIASGKTSYLISSRRIRAMVRLGEAELKANHFPDALATAETALAGERQIATRKAVESHEQVVLSSALTLAGQTNAAAGNFVRAESLLVEARGKAQSISEGGEMEDVIPLAKSEMALGSFYASRRRAGEARACFERLSDLWKRWPEENVYVDRQKTMVKRSLALLRN